MFINCCVATHHQVSPSCSVHKLFIALQSLTECWLCCSWSPNLTAKQCLTECSLCPSSSSSLTTVQCLRECWLCCSWSPNLTAKLSSVWQSVRCVPVHHQALPLCSVWESVGCVSAHHQALPLCSVHSQYCGSPRGGGLCSRSLDVHTVWSEYFSWVCCVAAPCSEVPHSPL